MIRSMTGFARTRAENETCEVDVELLETDAGRSPYPSVEDAYLLDDAREALRRGGIEAAGRHGCVYTATPVASRQWYRITMPSTRTACRTARLRHPVVFKVPATFSRFRSSRCRNSLLERRAVLLNVERRYCSSLILVFTFCDIPECSISNA